MIFDVVVRMKWCLCLLIMILFLIVRDFIFLVILSILMKFLLWVFCRGYGFFICFVVDFVDVFDCLLIVEDWWGGLCL